jgi:hypothetical protein
MTCTAKEAAASPPQFWARTVRVMVPVAAQE